MGFKVGIVAGVALGYVLATKMNQDTRDKIESVVNERIAQLRDDPRVRDVVDSVTSITRDAVDIVDEYATN